MFLYSVITDFSTSCGLVRLMCRSLTTYLICSADAFTKREKANEDYAIRTREKEKLLELKKKLAEQHEHLKKLEDHM